MSFKSSGFVSQANNEKSLCILPDWKKYIDQIKNGFDHKRDYCFMICGGKSTGKSTFVRYFINNILSIENVNAVGCIDLDPGQPEFSLPGNMSVSAFSSPVASFSQSEQTSCLYRKEMLFDSTAPILSLIKYYNITKLLRDTSKSLNTPIIVNTMGHVQNAGHSIIVDLIRIIEPSHVLALVSQNSLLNFKIKLFPEVINLEPRGYSDYSDNIVEFDGSEVPAFNACRNGPSRNRKKYRDSKVTSYLNKLLNSKGNMIVKNGRNLELSFDKCAIHTVRGDIQPAYHLLATYMQLVALCEVNSKLFIEHGKSRSKSLPLDSSWITSSNFLGYGIVIRVNLEQKTILLVTPLSGHEKKLVNTLVLTHIKIPMEFKKQFLSPSGMGIQKSALIPSVNYLPWFTWDEFEQVKKWTYSGNKIRMHKALQYILIWQSRLHISEDIGLSSTRQVLIGLLGLRNSNIERKYLLLKQCAAKFVTLTHFNKNKKWKEFIAMTKQIYPISLIVLRKNITHGTGTIAEVSCEEALVTELQLIKTYYWDRSAYDLENFYNMDANESTDMESECRDVKKEKENLDLVSPSFLNRLVFKKDTATRKRKRSASTGNSKDQLRKKKLTKK